MPPSERSGPAPGWYAYPSREGSSRWWDGTAWTDATTSAPRHPNVSDEVPIRGPQSVLLLWQGLTHALIMTPIAVVLALFASDNTFDGGMAVIGLPLLAASAATVTGAVSLLVGLPLRLSRRLRSWAEMHGRSFLLGALGACVVIIAGFFLGEAGYRNFPDTTVDGITYPAAVGYVPDWQLVAIGWVVLSFCVLHASGPDSWRSALNAPVTRRNSAA